MTEEQYKRAIEINNRLKALDEVMREIIISTTHKLSYVDSQNRPAPEWKMRYIGDLLDRHDTMIREEIKQEIANLLKEIETI